MKTVVLGASPNPMRYSNKAVRLLTQYGHEVIPIGIRESEIEGEKIITGKPMLSDVHTVTLYLGAERQAEYYEYIFALKPKRIIFNPGTENADLLKSAKDHGVETVINCTLVMLNTGLF